MPELELIIGNKNYSSWSLRPWVFLVQAEIPFTEIRLPFRSKEWEEKIGEYSPTRMVPALRDGEVRVWDSLAILEYLAEKFPKTGGWPRDAASRARARSASAEMHSSFVALRGELPQDCRARTERRISDATQRDVARVQELWSSCLAEGGPFLFGDFSIADAMYAPVALRFVTYGIPLDATAQAYVEQITSLPAVERWLRESEQESEVIDLFDTA
jgi:glutathione S-transferase